MFKKVMIVFVLLAMGGCQFLPGMGRNETPSMALSLFLEAAFNEEKVAAFDEYIGSAAKVEELGLSRDQLIEQRVERSIAAAQHPYKLTDETHRALVEGLFGIYNELQFAITGGERDNTSAKSYVKLQGLEMQKHIEKYQKKIEEAVAKGERTFATKDEQYNAAVMEAVKHLDEIEAVSNVISIEMLMNLTNGRWVPTTESIRSLFDYTTDIKYA